MKYNKLDKQQKTDLIHELYKKYDCINTVADKLGLHRTTVLYHLNKDGNTVRARGFKFYISLIKTVDHEIDDPVGMGQIMRKEFKAEYGLYPHQVSKAIGFPYFIHS